MPSMDGTRQMRGGRGPREVARGESVGDWVVHRSIATGGFGTVYEVQHCWSGERGALKLLHAHLLTSAETLARFDREIRIVRSLDHPNIVRLLDAGFTPDGRPYLCMEMLDGEELSAEIQRDVRLAPARALDVLEPICDSAATAHERGIIHRDIKSRNIMVCSDGRIVLLDFGIAKIGDALASELTATNQSLGTPACMAPEQIKGGRPDPRTDVYALGGLLFHMITGRQPFQDPSETMTQYLHLNARRPRASRIVKGIPESIDDVIVRAMAIDPAERFPDARSFVAAALAAGRNQAAAGPTQVDAIGVLIAVTDRTDGTALEASLFDDLESVLPKAERFLAERGFTLAVHMGSSAIFVAATSTVVNPTRLVLDVFEDIASRPGRDPRVQVGVCAHRDAVTYVGAEIQACRLLRPASWGVPDPLDGAWLTGALAPPSGRRVR
jgi:serine/threonine-protein kinase